MKVLLINGSPREDGCTYTALAEVAEQLEKQQIKTHIFHIGKKPIRGCLCRTSSCKELGYCAFSEDLVNECIDSIKDADGIIIGSPVYYASPHGSLMAFLDRLFYAGGSKFAYKPSAAIVTCRRGGAESALDSINKYFSKSNMPIVSSQYWNAIYGNTADDIKQDLEGIQIMRTLGNNMAWLLKCINSAKGIVPYPIKEKEPQRTNFIR